MFFPQKKIFNKFIKFNKHIVYLLDIMAEIKIKQMYKYKIFLKKYIKLNLLLIRSFQKERIK